jgi:nitroreductase
MSTQTQLTVKQAIEERSSIRDYEKGKRIPEATLDEILHLTSQAPSSWNLQHWKFIVIQDQAIKEKLLPIAFNQKQVVDCSALVVVLGDQQANLNTEKVNSLAVEKGDMPEDVKNKLVKQINDAYENNPEMGPREAIKNASLAAMQLMLAAKGLGVDSGPMGGYDADKLREALNIPDRYLPIMLITLGYRTKDAHASFRLSLDDIIVKETF